jgi:hypothetical protein
MIGAPAGQPEFAEWATLLGDAVAEVAQLRKWFSRFALTG